MIKLIFNISHNFLNHHSGFIQLAIEQVTLYFCVFSLAHKQHIVKKKNNSLSIFAHIIYMDQTTIVKFILKTLENTPVEEIEEELTALIKLKKQ